MNRQFALNFSKLHYSILLVAIAISKSTHVSILYVYSRILPFAKHRERERERDFPSSIFGKITYVSQSHQNTKPYISYMLPLFHAQYLTNEILTWVSNLTMKKNY